MAEKGWKPAPLHVMLPGQTVFPRFMKIPAASTDLVDNMVRDEAAEAIREAVAEVNEVRRDDDRLTPPAAAELERPRGTATQVPDRAELPAASSSIEGPAEVVEAELVHDESEADR